MFPSRCASRPADRRGVHLPALPAPRSRAEGGPEVHPQAPVFDFDSEDGDESDGEPAPRSRAGSPARRRKSGNPVGDFFVFRLMVTPLIIQIVFWLGVLASVGLGLRTIAEALDKNKPGRNEVSIYVLAMGIALTLGGPLLVRVYCELAIIFFKIHDELKEANDRQSYRS